MYSGRLGSGKSVLLTNIVEGLYLRWKAARSIIVLQTLAIRSVKDVFYGVGRAKSTRHPAKPSIKSDIEVYVRTEVVGRLATRISTISNSGLL